MIFLDANVFMYQIGREHPLRHRARDRVVAAARRGERLVTSAEVLQELLHVYRSRCRDEAFGDALALVERTVQDVWTLELADVRAAWDLGRAHPRLSARDLVHLASCVRRGAADLVTYDRALAAAWEAVA